MKVPLERIERVILSHWHSDHSGGLLSFLRLRREAVRSGQGESKLTLTEADPRPKEVSISPCIVDLHPDRPIARGIAPLGKLIGQLNPDPTFEAIANLGAVVETHAEGHAVAGDTVYVSGEIPRITPFEGGLLGAVRWKGDVKTKQGEWVPEEVSYYFRQEIGKRQSDNRLCSIGYNGRTVCCD